MPGSPLIIPTHIVCWYHFAQKFSQKRLIYSNNVGVYGPNPHFAFLPQYDGQMAFKLNKTNLQGSGPADHDPNMWVI